MKSKDRLYKKLKKIFIPFQDGYWINISPKNASPLKVINLKKIYLNITLYLLIVFTIISGVMLYKHISYHLWLIKSYGPVLRENKELKKEKKLLTSEKKELLKTIDRLKQEQREHIKELMECNLEFERLKKMVYDIKILSGLKVRDTTNKKKEDKNKTESEGGPDYEESLFYNALTDNKDADLHELILKKVKELKKTFANERKEVNKIRIHLVGRDYVISFVPEGNPLQNFIVVSEFGPRGNGFHSGIDLAAPVGTPVYATADGVVTVAGYYGKYGLMVEIIHGEDYSTRYAHLSKITVKVGDKIKKGELIGYVGATGNATGAHLHYEVRLNGIPVNPRPYLDIK